MLDELAAIVGPEHCLTAAADIGRYAGDWTGDWQGRPRAVLRPADTAQVSAILRHCHAQGIPVVPQGGNTGLVEGGVPSTDGTEIVLSLERLNRIRSVDTTGFTMVVEAGCILQSVVERAAEADCFFPLSLGARGSCQIGGTVATNAGGLNVLRWGMMRDLVLGLEVVLPDGAIWNGLSLLRKDNTGYDLKQLFIGAEGTLGVVTAASLKLFPRPTRIETCFLAVPSAEAALELYGRARRALSDLLSAYELITRPCLDLVFQHKPDLRDPLEATALWYVLLEVSASGLLEVRPLLEGFLEEAFASGLVVDGTLAESQAQAMTFWRLREDLVEAQYREAPHHLRTDISVPLAVLPDFLAKADAAMAARFPALRPIAYGHVGDGNLHYNVLPPSGEAADDLLEAAEAVLFEMAILRGGSISAEHGIGRAKREAFLGSLPDVDRRLMRMLKDGLDPRGILSPGRIL